MTLIMKFIERYLTIKNPIFSSMLGEMWGTFIMIVFGLGVIVQVEISGGSFLSISFGWGLAIMLALFWSGKLGHGHINPAVTLAFASIGRLEWKRVPLYWISQIFGAFLGALAIFLVYYEKIVEVANSKDNGTFVVESTGKFFVTLPSTSLQAAFFDQFFGTFMLSSCALAVTDPAGFNIPDFLHPIFLGLMVAAIVGCFAINAGAALNPARDLGPRIMLSIFGWGGEAFSAANYYFWVPIIAPLVGAVIGALFYQVCIGIHLQAKMDERRGNLEPSDKAEIPLCDFKSEVSVEDTKTP